MGLSSAPWLSAAQVNYYPSSIDKKDKPAPASTSTMSQYDNTGPRVRCDYQMEQEEFRQPGERYRSFDDDRWELGLTRRFGLRWPGVGGWVGGWVGRDADEGTAEHVTWRQPRHSQAVVCLL